MEWNFEVLEMQKWNVPTDIAQRVGAKNGAICLFIMIIHRVKALKMSKMALLLFCWWGQKISHSLAKYLSASERSFLVLLENAMDY